jgi:hypothetical protein
VCVRGGGWASRPFDAMTALSRCLTGSVAVLDRGAPWEAATKVLNAQMAGAEAVVMVNSDAGNMPRSIAAGVNDDAENVSIPVFLARREDGLSLLDDVRANPATVLDLRRLDSKRPAASNKQVHVRADLLASCFLSGYHFCPTSHLLLCCMSNSKCTCRSRW